MCDVRPRLLSGMDVLYSGLGVEMNIKLKCYNFGRKNNTFYAGIDRQNFHVAVEVQPGIR